MMNKCLRSAFYDYKKNLRTILLLSIFIYTIFCFFTTEINNFEDLLYIYLIGFQYVDYKMIFWLWLHIPIAGFCYGIFANGVSNIYYNRLIKYNNKLQYITICLILQHTEKKNMNIL